MCPDTTKALYDLSVEFLALKARVEALEPNKDPLADSPHWIPLVEYERLESTPRPLICPRIDSDIP